MLFNAFNKDNLDTILKELAKEYRKIAGKNIPAEIILVGGAAVIENYGFREMTTDIDALFSAASMMREAANNVGERLNIPEGWLNDDFKKTTSYSDKLYEVSKYYKTYYGVLNVRTISAEYLIAMKMKSGRQYKSDLSDIVGILWEHQKIGKPIPWSKIEKAIHTLYGSIENISDENIRVVKKIIAKKNYEEVYQSISENEKMARELLENFTANYPGVLGADNLKNILKQLKSKRDKDRK